MARGNYRTGCSCKARLRKKKVAMHVPRLISTPILHHNLIFVLEIDRRKFRLKWRAVTIELACSNKRSKSTLCKSVVATHVPRLISTPILHHNLILVSEIDRQKFRLKWRAVTIEPACSNERSKSAPCNNMGVVHVPRLISIPILHYNLILVSEIDREKSRLKWRAVTIELAARRKSAHLGCAQKKWPLCTFLSILQRHFCITIVFWHLQLIGKNTDFWDMELKL